jgi:methionyl aminopeptidase
VFGAPRIQVKTPEQLRTMRRAGLVVARTLQTLRAAVRPGISTGELNEIAEDAILGSGAVPSFLGYGEPPFPGSICASVNDEVVHGVPGDRVLAEGDVISIDCGAIVDGWHGDSATTIAVGEVDDAVAELMRVTEESLWSGIGSMRVGGRVGDIGAAVENSVRAVSDFGIVDDYTGHGIGSQMHMPPEVPNVSGTRGARLRGGMVLAIEPMITQGTADTRVADDEWTVLTRDGGWAAHYEHTVALTETGVWVLTALDGGRSELESRGIAFGGDDD